MKKKTLLCLFSVLTGMSLRADDVEQYVAQIKESGFPKVESLFEKLNNVEAALLAAKSSFLSQGVDLGRFTTMYQNLADKRDAAFACITAKFHAFQAAIVECAENKAYTSTLIANDTRILLGQLADLKNCTDKQIAHLNYDIDVLNENIRIITEDYKTLEAMSKEAVDAAVVQLNKIKVDYQDMLAVRTLFLSDLNNMIDAVSALEAADKASIQTLKNEICS